MQSSGMPLGNIKAWPQAERTLAELIRVLINDGTGRSVFLLADIFSPFLFLTYCSLLLTFTHHNCGHYKKKILQSNVYLNEPGLFGILSELDGFLHFSEPLNVPEHGRWVCTGSPSVRFHEISGCVTYKKDAIFSVLSYWVGDPPGEAADRADRCLGSVFKPAWKNVCDGNGRVFAPDLAIKRFGVGSLWHAGCRRAELCV